jgi:hypothetical protein
LVADYVNPELASALKDREIPFIDAAGNAFIKESPLYIFTMVDLGKKGRMLIDKADLLRRWVEAYPEQLKPKLVLGTFRADIQNWMRDFKPAAFDAFLGGETAAAELTGYLKAEKCVIYIDQPQGKLVFKYKLRKDPNGNVEILKRFWNFHWKTDAIGIVPPLLVYADLMAAGDSRNIEAAEMIYDKFFAELVRKD